MIKSVNEMIDEGEVYLVIESDKIGSQDFRFVYDVYFQNKKILRILQPANPSGFGVIDGVSIAVNLPSEPTSLEDVYLLVGEQYGKVVYDGITDVEGEPSYRINKFLAYFYDLRS